MPLPLFQQSNAQRLKTQQLSTTQSQTREATMHEVMMHEKTASLESENSQRDNAPQDEAIGREPHNQTRLIYIKTYGCSHNISDSEYMAGQLAASDFRVTVDERDAHHADLIIINSCTVKSPSQDSFFSTLKKYRRTYDKNRKLPIPIIVAGCVPQADRGNDAFDIHDASDPDQNASVTDTHESNARLNARGISMIGVRQIEHIVEVAERTLGGESVRLLDQGPLPSLQLNKVRKNKFVEIIPISVGCLNACTYCKTKHARGQLKSYHPQEIIARINQSIDQGITQVWLTSEDSGAYGRDIGTTLPDLLEQIVPRLPSHVMLRVGMTNPPYILEHLTRIAAILRHPQVFSFLHVPVQSGSDTVLRVMRRDYSVAEFQQVVDTIKKEVPGIMIATDIICGFPGESEEDFANTLALVERNIFPIMNISQFYPRPDTPASRMHLLPTQEVKRRSTALTRVFKAQHPYDALVGQELDVWTIAIEDGQVIGHTKSYVLTFLPLDETLLGKKVRARITHAGKHFIRGEIV